jgi:hypothetical protein
MIALVPESLSKNAVQVYLEPSTPPDEQKTDLACLIAIPPEDRCYNAQERTWTIYHPQRHTQTLPVLQQALTLIKQRSVQQAVPFQKK